MIKAMQEKDMDAVLEIENISFHAPWNKEQFLYELKDNEFAFLCILEVDGTCIGYLDFWITFESATLAKVAVLPQFQKLGYAKKLIEHMITVCEREMCENITLEVRVSNTAAIALYETFGFIKINIKIQYYNDNGEDAIYMMKPLGGNWK